MSYSLTMPATMSDKQTHTLESVHPPLCWVSPFLFNLVGRVLSALLSFCFFNFSSSLAPPLPPCGRITLLLTLSGDSPSPH